MITGHEINIRNLREEFEKQRDFLPLLFTDWPADRAFQITK
jgi:hypothetical protein